MSFSEDLYIYDLGETDFTHNGFPIVDFWEEPEINRQINGRYALTGLYMKEGQLSELIVKDAVIRAQVPDRTWQLFRIATIKDDGEYIQFTARFKGLDVNRNFIDNMIAKNQTVTSIMRMIGESLEFNQNYQFLSNMGSQHQFTIKQNHPIDAIIGSNSGNQNLISVVGGELDMYGNTFYLKEKLGNDNGFRIDFGINLESIVEIISEEEPPNTLYLIGATPEGDYDEEREPITLKYLEAPGMVITDENRVIATYTNENCKTVAELKEWADTELFGRQKVHMQKSAHEISLVDLANTLEYKDYLAYVELQLGDVIHGTLQRSRKNVTERVIEYTWYPRLKEYKKLGTGSSVDYYTEKAESKINTLLKKIDHNTDFLKESIINATQLITGNDKGHIMFWPKNRPRELRIMDTDDANTAKYVWRFNLAGLGHSSNGVDGPFPLAITQDGKIVADFITTGVLRAIDIIGVNIQGTNIEGSTIKGSTITGTDIFGALIETVSADFIKMKIALGRQEYYDASKPNSSRLGYIGMTKPSDPTLLIENTISGIASKMWFNKNNATISHSKLIQLISESIELTGKLSAPSANIKQRLDVKELYVDGVRLIPGQGGGGGGDWNGTYPPGVTSSADKFAWQAWAILIGKGYSKQAVAGILGNIQGEVGPAMNPDMSQVGGPAYGAVQWDGSAYPLVGSPTWNGREYVQRLMGAAGITKDYTTMSAQMDLLDWCMYNGQWIGAVSPTTVAGFKAVSDVAQAAHAFERNFERPAVAHPEREGWAVTWYNKFKDLQIITGGTWRVPIDNPITVTSEFGWRTSPINGGQELHNGIDLVGGTGPTTNIYASGAGTVVFAGWENSYGNYVIIQHANGLYTGYAHNSSLSVANGDNVVQGQKIANMGSTGDSTGAHTHFQFLRNGPWPSSSSDFINPREYINF